MLRARLGRRVRKRRRDLGVGEAGPRRQRQQRARLDEEAVEEVALGEQEVVLDGGEVPHQVSTHLQGGTPTEEEDDEENNRHSTTAGGAAFFGASGQPIMLRVPQPASCHNKAATNTTPPFLVVPRLDVGVSAGNTCAPPPLRAHHHQLPQHSGNTRPYRLHGVLKLYALEGLPLLQLPQLMRKRERVAADRQTRQRGRLEQWGRRTGVVHWCHIPQVETLYHGPAHQEGRPVTHLLGNSSCPSKAPEGCLSSHTALPTNRMVSATSGEMKSGSAAGSTT